MKHWLPVITGVIVLFGILWLSSPAIAPEDYAGIWYSCQGDAQYSFENGMITVASEGTSESRWCGAYVFCADRVFLFVQDMEGLEQEKQLHLIRKNSGNYLCEDPDGNGTVYFRRDPYRLSQ